MLHLKVVFFIILKHARKDIAFNPRVVKALNPRSFVIVAAPEQVVRRRVGV